MRRALWLALALAACQTPTTTPVGAACTRPSDCSAPLVCGAGRCRAECVETRDCPPGSECVPLGDAAACALTEDRCAVDTDCAAPLICGADGACRAACLTDADCTADGRCVLAGRLVCVAAPPRTAPTCVGPVNDAFEEGLDHWCIETGGGADASAVSASDGGFDRHTARIDLTNAPVGAWVRLYQEVPLVGDESFVFDRVSATVDGGTTLLAVELLDADGLVLGRVARAVAGDGESDCDETGLPTAACVVEPFSANVTMNPASASSSQFATVDLRRVASVRRVLELARTGTGPLELVADDVGSYPQPCVQAWWREGPHLAQFDLDDVAHPPAGFAFADAPLRAFVVSQCGMALAYDGSQTLDWTGPLPPVYTVSFMWHAPTHAVGMLDDLVLVHELGGDVELAVRTNQIVLTGCGQRIADSARLSTGDQRFQEMQVLVDRAAGRLCLARLGHLVGCMDAAACAGAAAPTGLRFLERATPIGDELGIDEIRIDTGVAMPDGTRPASRHCALDLACRPYMAFEMRDSGSGECVAPTDCADTWLCPEAAAAADATACGVTAPTMPCAIDPTCPYGVTPCDGSSCFSIRLEHCAQPLLDACP